VWPFVDPWKKHLDTPGAVDMEKLNSFIRSIKWWELVPSGLGGMRRLITDGGGADTTANYVAAAATPTGSLLVAYLPPAHEKSIEVDTKGMDKLLFAVWFDPTNGLSSNIYGSPFTNTGRLRFTPPPTNSRGERDWVLVLTAVDHLRIR